MSTQSTPFPNIGVSEKEKDKEYYTNWVKAIVSNSLGSSWVTNHNRLKLLYTFFLEGTGSDLTSYLQQGPDGSAMPGIWTSITTVKSKVRVLVGELEERGYQIKVRALNSEAEARKLEEKERLRIKRKLQGIRSFVEQQTGLPLESPEYVPQSEEELKEYMNLSWKDKHVMIIEAALKWIAHREHWDETRKRLFYDVLIANILIVKDEVYRGVPRSRHIDPMKFFFDPNASDDMLSDSTYFGEVEYMPLATAAEQYGLTEAEIQEAYKSYNSYCAMGEAKISHDNHTSWSSMPENGLKWFTTEGGIPRCLVIRGCWRDYRILSHKSEKNEKYGSEHIQDVSKDYKEQSKKKDSIIYNKIECWRQGTLVGGKFLREYGECPNQAREISNLELTEPPYKCWVPELFLGKTMSWVEQQVGLSLLKDIAMYKLQLETAKSVGRVLVLDMAMFPEGMTKEQVVSYMKSDGLVFVNSKEYQMGTGNINLFKDFDMGLSQSIAQNIALIAAYDQQLDAISGVNAERQGQVQGASQAVGVTTASIFQSNLITAPFFKGFERFCSRVLNHQAQLVKIAFAEKEVFAPIIGDVGVDFLKDNTDISLDQFDVVVQSLPPLTLDRQKLEEMLMIAVQSDPTMIDDALEIMLEPDTTVAVTKFKRKRLQRKRLEMLREQAMNEEQMAMQEQQMQAQAEQSDAQIQGQLELQNMKNQGSMDKTKATGRIKLAGQRLDMFRPK